MAASQESGIGGAGSQTHRKDELKPRAGQPQSANKASEWSEEVDSPSGSTVREIQTHTSRVQPPHWGSQN